MFVAGDPHAAVSYTSLVFPEQTVEMLRAKGAQGAGGRMDSAEHQSLLSFFLSGQGELVLGTYIMSLSWALLHPT